MRLLSILLSLLLLQWAFVALAETDYSYLDDMTINELKQLDAEIHKRIPQAEDSKDSKFSSDANEKETISWLNSLADTWVKSLEKPDIPFTELKLNESTETDFAVFTVLGFQLAHVESKYNNDKKAVTITKDGVSERFSVDKDSSLFIIYYKVLNIAKQTDTEYKPCNIEAMIHWNDYYSYKVTACKPWGKLEPGQEKTYIAIAEIPNRIAELGSADIIIEIGFNENFHFVYGETLNHTDYRYTISAEYGH